MFTLWNYIALGVIALVLLFIGFALGLNEFSSKRQKILIVIIEIVLIAGTVIGCGFYNTHTESGKRALKTWDSEKGGGLNRTVTVYDMQGEEVAKYQGKFDVEESHSDGVVKIKFDTDGKRHIIYAQTGTVLIDEN